MSAAKHTPGPWVLLDGAVIAVPNVDSKGANDFWRPAFTDGATPVQVANARLIAAAPELLEALGDCVSMLEVLLRTDADSDGAVSAQITEAKAAIAKAEGRL